MTRTQTILVGLIAAIVFASFAPGVIAGAPPTGKGASKAQALEAFIEKVDPFVKRADDGTFFVTVDDPDAIGITSEELANVKMALEETNRLVEKGEVVLDTGSVVGETINYNTNGSYRFWWGWLIALDHRNSQNLARRIDRGINAYDVVGFISAVASLPIPGSRLAAIIWGYLRVLQWGLERNDHGGGTYIYGVWWYPTFAVSSQ